MSWLHVGLLAVALAVAGSGAQAQQIKQRPLEPVQADAGPARVRIAEEDCRRLARYEPAPDVEYQPGGFSTTGKPVVPADLGGRPPLVLPEVYTFFIERKILGLPGQAKADLVIGTVTLDAASQRLAFNGQPLSTPLEDELAALCREKLRRGN